MCMLFAFTARKNYKINSCLREFFEYSDVNPEGWGLAAYNKDKEARLIKGAEAAYLSELNIETTNRRIATKLAVAHIRKATRGIASVENSHPFSAEINDENWIFAHNGTIFNLEYKNEVIFEPEGKTDSEMAFCYLKSLLVKNESRKLEDNINIIEKYIFRLAPYAKLNIVITDGTYLYMHSNYKNTLYTYENRDYVAVCTKPLNSLSRRYMWNEVELNRLLVYKENKLVYKGFKHSYEYFGKKQIGMMLYERRVM